MNLKKYFNNQKFIEFLTIEDAERWAAQYYKEWYKQDQCMLPTYNEIPNLIKMYCGNGSNSINNELRGYTETDLAIRTRAEKICREISKFELEDNIVVYRIMTIFDFEKMKVKPLEKLRRFSLLFDKGLMSTSLVLEKLLEDKRRFHYDIVLKIYLSKGVRGAYVGFISKRPKEQEFLIAPLTYLKVLKIKSLKDNKKLIICAFNTQDTNYH